MKPTHIAIITLVGCLLASVAFNVHNRQIITFLKETNSSLRTTVAKKDELIKQCEFDKQLTYGVEDAYQGKIADLNSQLSKLRSVRVQPKCTPIPAARKAGEHSSASAGTELRGGNGLSTEWLYDYAGRAEQVRLQLIHCQKFIDDVWSSRQ